jgi:hypothetical protein
LAGARRTATHTLRRLRGAVVLRRRAPRARDLRLVERRADIEAAKHIFVGSKAPWEEIIDDLPQLDEY